MNASELAYFLRRGHGPTYGASTVSGSAHCGCPCHTRPVAHVEPCCSAPTYRQLVASGQTSARSQFGLDDHLDALHHDLSDLEDEVDDMLDGEDEVFGIIPALIIGAASAAPAIAMAIKGKKKRLESLEKKLDKLKAKAEGADGKKADRLQKKIEKLEARVEKLKAKLGEDTSDDEDDEEFGLGPGLGSTYTFVPAALEDDEDDDDGEIFGSIPMELLGTHELTSADAATVDEGTILTVPVRPDPVLSQHANDAVHEGVQEFLQSYGGRRAGARSRR